MWRTREHARCRSAQEENNRGEHDKRDRRVKYLVAAGATTGDPQPPVHEGQLEVTPPNKSGRTSLAGPKPERRRSTHHTPKQLSPKKQAGNGHTARSLSKSSPKGRHRNGHQEGGMGEPPKTNFRRSQKNANWQTSPPSAKDLRPHCLCSRYPHLNPLGGLLTPKASHCIRYKHETT